MDVIDAMDMDLVMGSLRENKDSDSISSVDNTTENVVDVKPKAKKKKKTKTKKKEKLEISSEKMPSPKPSPESDPDKEESESESEDKVEVETVLTPEEIEAKRKADFRLSDRGEFGIKLYLDKLNEYREDLDKEKVKEEDLKLDIFEAIVKTEELDDYKKYKTEKA